MRLSRTPKQCAPFKSLPVVFGRRPDLNARSQSPTFRQQQKTTGPAIASTTTTITHRRPIAMASAANASSVGATSHQLLVVGPGVLGSYLGKLWVDEFGPGSVVGQTNTTNNHAKLQSLGIQPRTRDQSSSSQSFSNVVFSAPPSGSQDYVADIKAALALWDGSGTFVFTSSGGVYAADEGECAEDSPVVPLGANERTDRLLLAEQAVLEAGGCVVRLVGLYHKLRGAHTFFLKQGEVPRWGGYTVNLIHYEDAARLCAAVLKGQGSQEGQGYTGKIFLGCDNAPVTFQAMMEGIAASGVMPGTVKFTGPEGGVKGKKANNDATRKQLQWQPKYNSIEEFFKAGGEDWYSVNDGAPVGAPHA